MNGRAGGSRFNRADRRYMDSHHRSGFMKVRSLVISSLAVLTWVLAVSAQSSRPQAPATPAQPQAARLQGPATTPAQTRPVAATVAATPAVTADAQRAFFKQWCVGCHNTGAKATVDSSRKLQIDALDPANVDKDRKTWELIVRKVRAGQMPPSGMKRPEPTLFDSHMTALETELDRTDRKSVV